MPIETVLHDTSEFVATPRAEHDILADAFSTGDANYIAHALGVVARARGMTSIAKEAGVTREALYKALSEDGDPKLSTLMGVLKALGVKLEPHAA
jgi:probable addiction module antidote protein